MSRMVMKVYSAEFKADAVALYLSDPRNTFEGGAVATGQLDAGARHTSSQISAEVVA